MNDSGRLGVFFEGTPEFLREDFFFTVQNPRGFEKYAREIERIQQIYSMWSMPPRRAQIETSANPKRTPGI